MHSITLQSGHSEHCITPTQLRAAIEALREAAQRRHRFKGSKAKGRADNHLIAQSYVRTAQALDEVVRVLESDQTVVQLLALATTVPTSSETASAPIKPICAECDGENVSVDAAARWSVDIQDWVVSGVFETEASCDDCDNSDVELLWVDVERKPDQA